MTEIPYTTDVRPETRLTTPKLGLWLFLASDAMLFGSLFASYALLRGGAATWPDQSSLVSVTAGASAAAVMVMSSVAMMLAARAARSARLDSYRLWMALALCAGAVVLGVRAFEFNALVARGLRPATHNFLGLYFVMTGLHALHVAGGMIVNVYLWQPGRRMWHTKQRRFAGRVEVAAAFWHYVTLVWLFLYAVLYLL